MPTQLMSYDDLASTWGISREAARKKVEGLRLHRQTGNDGKTRVMIDLSEVQHQPMKPKRRPSGDRPETEVLRQHIETLRAEVERLLALVSTNRADFERERDRAEQAISNCLSLTDKLADAERSRAEKLVEIDNLKAAAELARAELTEWKAASWWRRAFG